MKKLYVVYTVKDNERKRAVVEELTAETLPKLQGLEPYDFAEVHASKFQAEKTANAWNRVYGCIACKVVKARLKREGNAL